MIKGNKTFNIWHVTSNYVPGESWFVIAPTEEEAIEEAKFYAEIEGTEYGDALFVVAWTEVYDNIDEDDTVVVGHCECG
jgi:hypothetical protein